MAPKFLGLVCENLNILTPGRFCTDYIFRLCFNFFDLVIDISLTYNIIKPHIKLLLYKGFLPNIFITPEDVDMFECDHNEFMHHQNSPLA